MSESLKFVKDVGSLGAWNTFSSAISFFTFYIITNLLGPEEYGKYALTFSIISTINFAIYASVNETLQRFSAITKDKRLVTHCAKLQSFFGVVALITIVILSKFIAEIYGKPIRAILIIISLSFLFMPLVETVKNFSIGKKKVKNFISLSFLNQALLLAFAFMMFFTNMRTALVMAFVYVIVSFLGFIYATQIIKKEYHEDDNKYNKSEVTEYIKNGFLFSFFKNIYFQSAVLIGGVFISSKEVAYFTFSVSIAMATIFAVVQAIQTMSTPYITSFYEKGETERSNKYFGANIKVGLFTSIVISIIVYLFFKLFMAQLFPKYVEAISIMPYVFLGFILINFTLPMPFLKAAGKLASLTKIAIFSAAFGIVTSYVLSKSFGLFGVVAAFVFNIITTSVIVWYYAAKELKIKFAVVPTKEEFVAVRLFSQLFFNKLKNLLKF